MDHPPVNALSLEVRTSLIENIERLNLDPAVHAIVITGVDGSFIAGADIREMDGPLLEPGLPDVIAAIEASPKPVVAAIGKMALGGGAELALACHMRIAADNARFGFPEVSLGIMPGSGGIPRLIRAVAPSIALEMVASGKPIDAFTALQIGLVDEIFPSSELVQRAAEAARSLAGQPLNRISARPVIASDPSNFDAEATRWTKKAKGQQSVKDVVDAVRHSLTASFEDSRDRTRCDFLCLRDSEQAKALRYQFFAQRSAHRVDGVDRSQALRIRKVAVIGGGTMGSGIAGVCLRADYDTLLVDVSPASIEQARTRIEESLRKTAKSERWSEERIEGCISRLSTSTDHASVEDCELVIEAIFEDEAVKKTLLSSLVHHVSPQALIATNTSYLDIDELASVTADPSRFLGLHFFAPAEVMRLVEVVRGKVTSVETLATGLEFAKSLSKLPVATGVCEGFIVNRILSRYRREMEAVLLEGALPEEIDDALENFGMALGPFATADLSGLDIAWARRKHLAAKHPETASSPSVADRLCQLGRFGRKTESGWYKYESGVRRPDPAVRHLIVEDAERRGIVRREISREEIVGRAIGVMVSEGRAILSNGVAARESDIDAAMVNGLGFPAWRGGPMYFATRSGVVDMSA
ncbi:3-hydroxyacyl-CoA dehydrogenase [Neorhizobium galegae]|nr:3-hydroxyacyl-CoA dehydrogenase [Neorhizobium galegae]